MSPSSEPTRTPVGASWLPGIRSCHQTPIRKPISYTANVTIAKTTGNQRIGI